MVFVIIENIDNETVLSLDDLRDAILPLVERYALSSPALFGSYARGEASPTSDIDLLVDRNGQRYLVLGGFMEDLYLATGKRVDVYDYSELEDGDFKRSIEEDLLPL